MDIQLIAALLIGVAVIIALILWTRFDAFMALLTGALLTGLIAGVPIAEIAVLVSDGFGDTLGTIGIVIGLGVMIGKVLEITGAADVLAAFFIRLAGKNREDWGLAGTGALVSIPVFCDSGYVILTPLARSLTRRSGRSFVTLSLALGAGLVITHHLVPPTPGPLAVAGLLDLDLGQLIVGGVVFTIPLIAVAVLYARWIGPRLDSEVRAEVRAEVLQEVAPGRSAGSAGPGPPTEGGVANATDPTTPSPPPGIWKSVAPLLIPILLIVGNTVATAVVEEGSQVRNLFTFIGNPIVAVLIGLTLALYTLVPRDADRGTVTGWLIAAASSAGIIIFITGAGGALGNVLRESGVADELANTVAGWPIPAFLVPFAIATFVRFAQGSGTVAMITSGALTAPLIPGLGLDPLVAALAALTGAFFFSYFNDSYFWVVTRFTGLEGTAAIRAWSGMTTVLWAAAFVEVAIASVIL